VPLTESPPVLVTRDLTVRFGGHVAVDRVSAAFFRGTLTAIIGPNGAGKTTYFNLISGQVRPTSGSVLLKGADITRLSPSARTKRGIARAFQLTSLFPDLSVRENVRLVVQSKASRGPDVLHRAGALAELADRAMAVLGRVRLTALADRKVSALAHGDQRKLEVAMLIALDPDIYMFDEPTAGVSLDEMPAIIELIGELTADPSKTILLVEHKMDVIRALADRIIVLTNGRVAADGAPALVMASAAVQRAYLGSTADA
jgi:branched-chain amino acid transport system ATP-binding protein